MRYCQKQRSINVFCALRFQMFHHISACFQINKHQISTRFHLCFFLSEVKWGGDCFTRFCLRLSECMSVNIQCRWCLRVTKCSRYRSDISAAVDQQGSVEMTEAVDIDIAQIISLAKLPQPIDRRCVAHMNCLIPYMQPMDTLNYGITTIVSWCLRVSVMVVPPNL